MVDFNLDDIVARVKANPIAIPAIAVGGGVGLFLLIRNQSKGGVIVPEIVDDIPVDETGTGGELPVGGGAETPAQDTSFLEDLQRQITSLAEDFIGAINQLSESFTGQLNQQSQDTQSLVDSLQEQINNFDDRDYTTDAFNGYLPYQAANNVPIEYAYASPIVYSDASNVSQSNARIMGLQKQQKVSLKTFVDRAKPSQPIRSKIITKRQIVQSKRQPVRTIRSGSIGGAAKVAAKTKIYRPQEKVNTFATKKIAKKVK